MKAMNTYILSISYFALAAVLIALAFLRWPRKPNIAALSPLGNSGRYYLATMGDEWGLYRLNGKELDLVQSGKLQYKEGKPLAVATAPLVEAEFWLQTPFAAPSTLPTEKP
jgi:hypothetical protein